MIMIAGSNDVSRYPALSQTGGDRCGEADRIQAGMHTQGDAFEYALIVQTLCIRPLPGDKETEPFCLTEACQRFQADRLSDTGFVTVQKT